MAFVFAAETAGRLTATAVHVHGGYGAALEYDIQLFHPGPRRGPTWPGPPGGRTPRSAGPSAGSRTTPA